MIEPAFPTAGTLIALTAVLLAAGIAAGFIAGLLGVGGGIIIVPVLYQVFTVLDVPPDVRMHTAVGTSLATIVATGFRSARAHYSRGAVDTGLLKRWGLPLVVGAGAGSVLASVVGGDGLTAVFAVVALAVAVQQSVVSPDTRLRDGLPAEPVCGLIGTGVGTVATLMGIGGGMLTVPTLRLCGYATRTAVGTASAVGLIIAVPAAAGFMVAGWGTPGRLVLSAGYVNVLGFATIAAASMLIAPIGARVAHSIPQSVLRGIFALFLVAAAARLLYGSISG